jgi:glycerate kinase
VAAPDKFRGSVSAVEAAQAIHDAVLDHGGTCSMLPLADGGEGTLDAFGGANRWSEVTGPLGTPVRAGWRLDGDRAVIEMAQASGLLVAGGREHNDPEGATTRGVGELVAEALDAGATRIIVGVGGSATTDGGQGALEVLDRPVPAEILVCCDVTTRFTDAARVFGPQKGATPDQVDRLTARLERLQDRYRQRYGVDVSVLPGSGAAGGLAGGLAALGARLVPGFPLVAGEAGLAGALAGADLVVTGEGLLDEGSFAGKVVGGVVSVAAGLGVPVLAVVGQARPEARGRIPTLALLDHFSEAEAWDRTQDCIRRLTAAHLARA